MTQAPAAARNFIASLHELVAVLGLPQDRALASYLAGRLVDFRDGRAPQRDLIDGVVHATQHGIGFVLRWPGHFIDVDVSRMYLEAAPQQVVFDAWKVASCEAELGRSTGPEEATAQLEALADEGLYDREDGRSLWPAVSPR